MPLKPGNVAAFTGGIIILYSGIKGATISDTLHAALKGNLNVTDTEPIGSVPNSPTTSGGVSTSAVSGSGSKNYITIANYLVENGYTKIAAAGICGCIAGESGGDPEALQDKGTPVASNSGGGGLIQWTPISAHPNYVTGNATKDLDTQLPAIIEYNNGRGAFHISALNQQSSPVAAADYYSQYFEAPAVKDSDVVASVANSVYKAINVTGNTPQAPTG